MRACVTSVSYNWGVREGFFAVCSGLKERYTRLQHDIFGSAGLKEVVKGVQSVLVDFCCG